MLAARARNEANANGIEEIIGSAAVSDLFGEKNQS